MFIYDFSKSYRFYDTLMDPLCVCVWGERGRQQVIIFQVLFFLSIIITMIIILQYSSVICFLFTCILVYYSLTSSTQRKTIGVVFLTLYNYLSVERFLANTVICIKPVHPCIMQSHIKQFQNCWTISQFYAIFFPHLDIVDCLVDHTS
jgi:hypothetical protein